MSPATSVVAIMVAAAAGAAAGSYAGVVGDRGWHGSLTGRSRCASCDRELRWWELLPVVSFLALGGRCRRCGAPIPMRLLAVETIGAVVGAVVAGLIVLTLR